MSEESALPRLIVPLFRKRITPHELAFAVLNSSINDPQRATATFKSDKSGTTYPLTCHKPKRVDGITVVVAKKNNREDVLEDGGVGTITVTVNGPGGSSETTSGTGGLGEPTP
jgi:hypothetical protein